MENGPSPVTFRKKRPPGGARFALAAIVIALVGFGLGFVPPAEEPVVIVEKPTPPPESDTAADRVLDAGRDLAEAIRHGLTGDYPTPTPTPTPIPPTLPVVGRVSSFGVARSFSVLLGIGAVLLGTFSWFTRENHWLSGAAIVFGLLTVASNALLVAAVAAGFAIAATLVSWKVGSRGTVRPVE